MKGKMILTIGELIVEIVASTKGNGFLEPQPLIGPFPSGAPAIFIDQVGKLDIPCAMISRVGDDDFGELNIRRLRQDGVNVSGIAVAKGETTGSAFVRYQDDGNRKFVFNISHSACGKIVSTMENKQLLQHCDHLHLMGSALSAVGLRDFVLQAVAQVHSRGGSISFDPNLRAEMMNISGLRQALDAVLNKTDIFLPSGNELFLFTMAQEENAAIAELHARGITEIVLKRGHHGATYFACDTQIDIAPLAVTEVDPTGAGDTFGAVFVGLRLNGYSAMEALRYANAAGARAVTFTGPMEGTSTFDELNAFLTNH